MSAQVRFLPSAEVLPRMRLPHIYKKWILEWQVRAAPRSRSIKKSRKEFLLEGLSLELKLVRSAGQEEGDKPSATIPAAPGATRAGPRGSRVLLPRWDMQRPGRSTWGHVMKTKKPGPSPSASQEMKPQKLHLHKFCRRLVLRQMFENPDLVP